MSSTKADDDPDVGPPPDAQVDYYEPARSYLGALPFAVLLAAGFVLDLALGGGVAHLPGWLLAFAFVVGTNVLVLYAARKTKSLTLTSDELWVGEEVVQRPELAGAAPGVNAELPVLGWPGGMPRGVKGVIVTLADDSEVVVPTRFPERLAAALGLGHAAPRPELVRPATSEDLAYVPDIDTRAEMLFRVAGHALPDIATDVDELARAAAVFVVGNPPIGYVWLEEVDGLAHVQELAVVPKRMRQGLGTALLEHACTWAHGAGYPAITLTTYAEIAWNAPFYAARGFVDIAELTPGLTGLRLREANLGLDGVGPRVVMRRELG